MNKLLGLSKVIFKWRKWLTSSKGRYAMCNYSQYMTKILVHELLPVLQLIQESRLSPAWPVKIAPIFVPALNHPIPIFTVKPQSGFSMTAAKGQRTLIYVIFQCAPEHRPHCYDLLIFQFIFLLLLPGLGPRQGAMPMLAAVQPADWERRRAASPAPIVCFLTAPDKKACKFNRMRRLLSHLSVTVTLPRCGSI